MGESPQVTATFVDADQLAAFLESLRAAGYRIGTEKFVAAHEIALAVSAEPRESRTSERLCSLLRPLLCSSAAEQEEFAQRFRPWANRIVPERRTAEPAETSTPIVTPAPALPPVTEAPLAESLAAMRRISTGFWMTAAIIAAILAGAIWVGLRPEVRATVHIQSMPEGAVVRVVDGSPETLADDSPGDSIGRTNHEWSDVAPDRYTLHFHLAGYRDTSHVVTVSGDSIHHVTVVLSQTPRGSVAYDTEPAGATIRIQPITREHGSELIDTARTATTPVQWADLSVGTYRVVMSMEGFDPATDTVVVDPGQPVERRITLQRTRLGMLRIESEPAGARVSLNGSDAGSTPIELERPVGTYAVALSSPQHRDSAFSITVRENERTDTAVVLTARGAGRLVVRTDPAGARVLVDDIERPSDAGPVLLFEGSHSVRAELQGYEPFVADAVVLPDSTTVVAATLTLLQPPRYRVAFHPDTSLIATGDPGASVVMWNEMSVPAGVLRASDLRVRRAAFRDANRPWSIVGRNRFSDTVGYDRNLNDIVATDSSGRFIAVSSSGPFGALFDDGLSGDSIVEVRVFDSHGFMQPDVSGIFGGGVLALRFNRAADTLYAVMRNGHIAKGAVQPCATARVCAANLWEPTVESPFHSRSIQAAWFESDTLVTFVDEEGEIGRLSLSTRNSSVANNTGIRDALKLASTGGVSAILSDTGTLRISWDASDFSQPDVHRSIASVALGMDGQVLITGTDTGTVLHWSQYSGSQTIAARRHRDAVTHVAISPDGRYVASASMDGTLALWDLVADKWITSVWLHRMGVTSLDSAILGRPRWTERTVLSWSDFPSTDADRIQQSDYADPPSSTGGFSGRSRFALPGETLEPRALTFSPDGNAIVVVTSDGQVRRWNVGLADRPDWQQRLVQHIALSPDQEELVVPGAAGTVEVWDTRLREKRETLSGHGAHVTGIAYSPDHSRLATGDVNGEVRIWARTPTVRLWLSAFDPIRTQIADSSAIPLAYSHDGARLASRGDGNEVLIYDAHEGLHERTIVLNEAIALSLAFSPKGDWLAVGDAAGSLHVLPLPEGESLPVANIGAAIYSIAWPNDSTVVLSMSDGVQALQISSESSIAGGSLSLVPGDAFMKTSDWLSYGGRVVFSGDGRTITRHEVVTVDPYDLSDVTALRSSIRPLASNATFSSLDVSAPYPTTSVALSDDGIWLAVADTNRNIHVLDTRSGRALGPLEDDAYPWADDPTRIVLENRLDTLSFNDGVLLSGQGHEARIHAMAFSPDNRTLASSAEDSTLVFWDLRNGNQIGYSQYSGTDIRTLAFHPSGRMLASLGADGLIRVWDLGLGVLLGAHRGEITSLSFNTDQRRLVSASADSTMIVWDLWGFTPFDTIRAGQPIESVAFSPDGRQLIAATADSAIHVWDASGSRMATIGQWLSNAIAVGGLIVVITGAFVLHRYLWRRRAERILVRRQSEERPEIHHFALRNAQGYVFPQASMIELARRLRRRVEFVSDHLDVPETVSKTVRRGVFTAAFMNRQERPEYVALVDRASIGDQQTAFVDDLLDRLVADDVPIERYYFDGDPGICFPRSRRGRPLSLAAVAQRNAGRRLLVFSDASALFDPVTGAPIESVDPLQGWLERAWLTPEPRQHWTSREAVLAEDFNVEAATHAGLLSLTDKAAGPANHSAPIMGNYPATLRRRPRRWVERDRPDIVEVERMMTALRAYLDEPGMLWLCACAVYPEMNWRLTVNLGVLLHDASGEPLVNADRLMALARLPWFRHDYMPDWMRARLLDELTAERERQIRSAIEKLLVAAAVGSDDPHDLEIAEQQAHTLHTLARSLLAVMRRDAQPGEAARDYVFQAFMSGRHAERLAVRLPRALALLMNRRHREAMPARLRADARRLQFAALAGVPVLAMLVFGGTTAWSLVPERMVRLGESRQLDVTRAFNTDSMIALLPADTVVSAEVAELPAAQDPASYKEFGPIDLVTFLDGYRAIFGAQNPEITSALETLVRFLNNDPGMKDLRYRAFALASVKVFTRDRFMPVVEEGATSYFDAYEPGTELGQRVGNVEPGDGVRYRGRGYIPTIRGRENYALLSKLLGYEPKMTDLVDTPDRLLQPEVAYRVVSIGLIDGLFNGRRIAEFINDEQTDYLAAATVVADPRSQEIERAARLFEQILLDSASRESGAAGSSY